MLKILFMGTPAFSVPILEALIEKYEVIGVVTQPDKMVGRHHEIVYSPVKVCALKHQIKVYQPTKIRKEENELIALQPDLIVTAAYGQIVGVNLLEAPRFKSINVHGSLLPKYRGGAPIQRAIMNGEKETGITIMYMAKGMDSGDILRQQAVTIDSMETSTTLFDKLSLVGRDLLMEVIPDLISGKIKPIKQNEDEVTFGLNIQASEEALDFNQDAKALDCKIRALLDSPCAYFNFIGFPSEADRMKVLKAEIGPSHNLPIGSVFEVTKKSFCIACGANSSIRILKLQPSGKKPMDAASFINGSLKKYVR